MLKNKKIVVFASGSGTNFINLYNNVKNGEIVLLISNNSNSGAIRYAIENQIDYKVINDFSYPDINIKCIDINNLKILLERIDNLRDDKGSRIIKKRYEPKGNSLNLIIESDPFINQNRSN